MADLDTSQLTVADIAERSGVTVFFLHCGAPGAEDRVSFLLPKSCMVCGEPMPAADACWSLSELLQHPRPHSHGLCGNPECRRALTGGEE